ncbi:MAG: MerC domain-containing protein [Proteobacteria bacterium]|nr:MerC domain-containing protein [Pseudomonadota bacterium]
MSAKAKHVGFDSFGQLLSLLCIVHCALMPWVLLSLPAATPFMESGHPVLFVCVLATCLLALVPGSRQHRRWGAWPWALTGIALLAAAMLFFHEEPLHEMLVSSGGALCMLMAHHKNRQHLKHCSCCRKPQKKPAEYTP